VLGAVPSPVPLATLEESFTRLQLYSEIGEEEQVLKIVRDLIPGYERTLTSAMQRSAKLAPVIDEAPRTDMVITPPRIGPQDLSAALPG
jgi:hypothetical protein